MEKGLSVASLVEWMNEWRMNEWIEWINQSNWINPRMMWKELSLMDDDWRKTDDRWLEWRINDGDGRMMDGGIDGDGRWMVMEDGWYRTLVLNNVSIRL